MARKQKNGYGGWKSATLSQYYDSECFAVQWFLSGGALRGISLSLTRCSVFLFCFVWIENSNTENHLLGAQFVYFAFNSRFLGKWVFGGEVIRT